MLIVIVIIGILTAAIIPRLNSARGRANDVARKADLNQVATALITYQLDTGGFPATGTTIDNISSQLIAGWMTSIPKDPANNKTFSGVEWVSPWLDSQYYLYRSIRKWGMDDWWFVLMAQMESHGQANYVFCPTSTGIQQSNEYNQIHLCQKIDKVAVPGCSQATNTNSDCEYSDLNQLRYIYKY